jgi:hypothetical protein
LQPRGDGRVAFLFPDYEYQTYIKGFIMKKAALRKGDIFATRDLATQEIDVPEWGGVVYVRELAARQAIALEKIASPGGTEAVEDRGRRMMDFMLVESVCDHEDKPIFTADDLPALHEKKSAVLMRLFNAALKINGLDKASAEASAKKSDGEIAAASPSV